MLIEMYVKWNVFIKTAVKTFTIEHFSQGTHEVATLKLLFSFGTASDM